MYKSPEENFRERLRELLAKRGEKAKLAAALNRSTSAISQYLSGARFPDNETLCQIAKYFHTSIDYLFGNTDVMLNNADVRSTAEFSGLSEETIVMFKELPETAQIIEGILQNLPHDVNNDAILEGTLICNMIQRINISNRNGSSAQTHEAYLPDDANTVRIGSDEFFGYHARRLSDCIAKSIEIWACKQCGVERAEDRPADELPF